MMANSNRLERQLSILGRLRQTPITEEGLAALREALSSRSSALVASAARIAGSRGLLELEEELAMAFERLAPGAVKADPGCNAKTAIVDALARLGSRREDIFMAGIHIVQMEPVWGGQEDTAAPLRAASALGLAGTRPPDLMILLADLLADPVPDARLGAVAAVAAAGDPAGVPLLRLKVRLGDVQPQLAFDCLSALVRLDPDGAQPLLAELLEHDDLTTAEAAALALGESGLANASRLLQDWYEHTLDKERRAAALAGLALLRDEESLRFLFALLASGPPPVAETALRALALQRGDPPLWARVTATVAARSDLSLPDHLR